MTDTLALRFAKDDLSALAPEWPDGVGLVLCMDKSGRHATQVIRDGQDDNLRQLLEDTFRRPLPEIAVYPSLEGCHDAKISFSDWQKFISFLKERIFDLLDEAIDYDMNYRFAVDQGLDPDMFTSAGRTPILAHFTLGAGPSVDKTVQKADPFGEKTHHAHPLGYTALTPEVCRQSAAVRGRMYLLDTGDMAISPIGDVTHSTLVAGGGIFARNDLQGLAISVRAGSDKIDTRFVVPSTLVPKAMVSDLRDGSIPVTLALLGDFLHVSLVQNLGVENMNAKFLRESSFPSSAENQIKKLVRTSQEGVSPGFATAAAKTTENEALAGASYKPSRPASPAKASKVQIATVGGARRKSLAAALMIAGALAFIPDLDGVGLQAEIAGVEVETALTDGMALETIMWSLAGTAGRVDPRKSFY